MRLLRLLSSTQMHFHRHQKIASRTEPSLGQLNMDDLSCTFLLLMAHLTFVDEYGHLDQLRFCLAEPSVVDWSIKAVQSRAT
jgi:hypothetical protein